MRSEASSASEEREAKRLLPAWMQVAGYGSLHLPRDRRDMRDSRREGAEPIGGQVMKADRLNQANTSTTCAAPNKAGTLQRTGRGSFSSATTISAIETGLQNM